MADGRGGSFREDDPHICQRDSSNAYYEGIGYCKADSRPPTVRRLAVGLSTGHCLLRFVIGAHTCAPMSLRGANNEVQWDPQGKWIRTDRKTTAHASSPQDGVRGCPIATPI